jgi:hypothetical protein
VQGRATPPRTEADARVATHPDLHLRDAGIAQMRFDPSIGPRLRHFMIYAAHDLRAQGTTTEREQNFGVLQNNLATKGAYSTEVRDQLDE